MSSYGEIPNITGSFVPWVYGNASTSGVFTNSGSGTASSWGTPDVHQGTVVHFNANRASTVYVNVSRVMPAVIAVQFLIKYI